MTDPKTTTKEKPVLKAGKTEKEKKKKKLKSALFAGVSKKDDSDDSSDDSDSSSDSEEERKKAKKKSKKSKKKVQESSEDEENEETNDTQNQQQQQQADDLLGMGGSNDFDPLKMMESSSTDQTAGAPVTDILSDPSIESALGGQPAPVQPPTAANVQPTGVFGTAPILPQNLPAGGQPGLFSQPGQPMPYMPGPGMGQPGAVQQQYAYPPGQVPMQMPGQAPAQVPGQAPGQAAQATAPPANDDSSDPFKDLI